MSMSCKDKLRDSFAMYRVDYASAWGFRSWTHIMRVGPVYVQADPAATWFSSRDTVSPDSTYSCHCPVPLCLCKLHKIFKKGSGVDCDIAFS